MVSEPVSTRASQQHHMSNPSACSFLIVRVRLAYTHCWGGASTDNSCRTLIHTPNPNLLSFLTLVHSPTALGSSWRERSLTHGRAHIYLQQTKQRLPAGRVGKVALLTYHFMVQACFPPGTESPAAAVHLRSDWSAFLSGS